MKKYINEEIDLERLKGAILLSAATLIVTLFIDLARPLNEWICEQSSCNIIIIDLGRMIASSFAIASISFVVSNLILKSELRKDSVTFYLICIATALNFAAVVLLKYSLSNLWIVMSLLFSILTTILILCHILSLLYFAKFNGRRKPF